MGITPQQALDCFASDDLIGIGMEADALRRQLHPEGVVAYTLDAVIDLGSSTPVEAQIEDALEDAATGITLRNTAGLDLPALERSLLNIRKRFPALHIRGLSAVEASSLAESTPLEEFFPRLRAAGLDALLGHGADALGTERYLAIHRAAHLTGIPSTAELVFGAGDSSAERVAFLEALRALQAETGGFLALTLTSAPAATGRELDDPTAVEYLKTLAICRMLLDNVAHIQPNLPQQGLKVLQMGLRFGGNDAGSILHVHAASEEELRRVIRDAGFKPAQRDPLYRSFFLN
jgi:cyclic dehypoxanthinyl futalosine synthase